MWWTQETTKTVAADKGYDTTEYVASCRGMNVTPHVVRNDKRRGGSAINCRTSCQQGYKTSIKVSKRVEVSFGWGKTVGIIRPAKSLGIDRVNDIFNMTMTGEFNPDQKFTGSIRQVIRNGGKLRQLH